MRREEPSHFPSLDAVSLFWVQRKNRYGPERIGAHFAWMESFDSKEQAEREFDIQEENLLNLVMDFLQYIRALTHVNRQITVLEEASGAGNLTIVLAEKPEEYCVNAIDICLALVHYSQQRLETAGFPEAAKRICFGIAQHILELYGRRILPPPQIFTAKSHDMVIWGRLDHRLLGMFYQALGQAIDLLVDEGVMFVYSLSRKDNPDLNARPGYDRWAWVRDEEDYEHYSQLRRDCGKSFLVPLGERWSHTHCGQQYFLRAWQKHPPLR